MERGLEVGVMGRSSRLGPVECNFSFSQIGVFDASLERPFNDWSDDHVRQGFAWRPGSVFFGTLVESGTAQVSVLFADEVPDLSWARRAIVVPFVSGVGAQLEVGSVSDSFLIRLSRDVGSLVFAQGLSSSGEPLRCDAVFLPGSSSPAVLIEDDEVKAVRSFDMDARPA